METVTFEGKDFSTVHNALCELRGLAQSNSLLSDPLEKIIKKFEAGLKDCYDQDRAFFDIKYDHYKEVAEKNGFVSIWSLYSVSDLTQYHPYSPTCSVVYNGNRVPVEGSTWVDLWHAADQCIRQSGDSSHIFIEKFVKANSDGTELNLVTGS